MSSYKTLFDLLPAIFMGLLFYAAVRDDVGLSPILSFIITTPELFGILSILAILSITVKNIIEIYMMVKK